MLHFRYQNVLLSDNICNESIDTSQCADNVSDHDIQVDKHYILNDNDVIQSSHDGIHVSAPDY